MEKGTEKDDYEPISQHFVVMEEKTGEFLACAKLFEKEAGLAWVSHMAVATGNQHQGIGKLLLNHIEQIASQQGYQSIGCLSRLNTTKFFEKAGYAISGLPTHYFGTTQVVWMEKKL